MLRRWCSIVIEKSKVRMSRYLDTSTETQMAKIMVQHGRPSRSSWAKSVRSPFGRTVEGEGNSRKLHWNTVGICGRYKAGWEETQSGPNVDNTHERPWFGRTNIIPWPCLFGLHPTRMRNEQRYCGKLQKYVWIRICWSHRKATLIRETWRGHLFIVLWYGRSCKKVSGKILRIGE